MDINIGHFILVSAFITKTAGANVPHGRSSSSNNNSYLFFIYFFTRGALRALYIASVKRFHHNSCFPQGFHKHGFTVRQGSTSCSLTQIKHTSRIPFEFGRRTDTPRFGLLRPPGVFAELSVPRPPSSLSPL